MLLYGGIFITCFWEFFLQYKLHQIVGVVCVCRLVSFKWTSTPGIYWPAKLLIVSQEGISSTELVSVGRGGEKTALFEY